MKQALLIGLAAIAVIASTSWAEIQTQIVNYQDGNVQLEGFLAWDNAMQGPRPGVLVVHQWKGLGDYEMRRARELAQLGYVAFAIDMYGKGVRPETAEEAGKLAGIFKNDRALTRTRAAVGLGVLESNPLTADQPIAVIGYCFGGMVALELARSGAPIAGTVSFHGSLDTPHPEDASHIQGKVLALQGADDPYAPPAQVEAFQKEMRDAHVDWQFISYGGSVHAFTDPGAGNDPSKGAAYNAAADRRSWQAMKDFFAEIFSPK
ncbi:MAG TPA: dienelactone hydrolase family protein [Kiritimatiellia bacterium]|nr:dienelactone hydrolase family protein [Kiritimatiellia bacterium]